MSKLYSNPAGTLKLLGSRFGFHNGSSIDSLLDKEDVSLEAILDEDDLLQECKAQNTGLIDYFQRSDVLQRLLGYVTGDIKVFKCKYQQTPELQGLKLFSAQVAMDDAQGQVVPPGSSKRRPPPSIKEGKEEDPPKRSKVTC